MYIVWYMNAIDMLYTCYKHDISMLYKCCITNIEMIYINELTTTPSIYYSYHITFNNIAALQLQEQCVALHCICATLQMCCTASVLATTAVLAEAPRCNFGTLSWSAPNGVGLPSPSALHQEHLLTHLRHLLLHEEHLLTHIDKLVLRDVLLHALLRLLHALLQRCCSQCELDRTLICRSPPR